MTTIPTVSPTELIRSSWGNAVAGELNVRTVKVDGSMPMTGPLVITAAPAVRLRQAGDTPYVRFENTTGATLFGYVQGSAAAMIYQADAAASSHRFVVHGVEVARFDSGGLVLPAGMTLDTTGKLSGGVGQFANTTGGQLVVVDSNGGGDAAQANVAFYPSATSATVLGTRGAYVGYAGFGFRVQATGDVTLDAGDQIMFNSNGANRGQVSALGRLLWGKAATDIANAGVELDVGGQMLGTVDVAVPNVIWNRVGSANAAGGEFARFDVAGVEKGSITWETSDSKVHYNQTSDRRLKDDVGAVDDPAARLRRLRPRRLAWKDNGVSFDGFIADEVAAVVPEAVSGAPDALNPDGTIRPQQLAVMELVPLLTAALQEAFDRLERLEGGV